VHWSVRHTQSFRCPLIYPIKWDNWLLHCIFLTKKGKHLFYKLRVLTKYFTVMLLIVLAEAALGWNYLFWSYFVVIFRVGGDVLYRSQQIVVIYVCVPLSSRSWSYGSRIYNYLCYKCLSSLTWVHVQFTQHYTSMIKVC
jgi:hypothetical protein